MLKKISEEQRKIAGITIIALTVSIVILIILAGISTNLILGKNGLIKRAQEAKDKSEEHSKNEEIERQELYNAWAGGTSGGTVVKKAHLSATAKVTSPAANGSKYGLGEQIEFEINITNESNLTCSNITVWIKRKETGEYYWAPNSDMAEIGNLKPGETRNIQFSYNVCEQDIENYRTITYEAIINGMTEETNIKIDTVTVESDSALVNNVNLERWMQIINPASDVMYDGTEHKWIPKLKNDLGEVLVEGTDYTVSYSTTDFTNVTGIIEVVITGKGIYKQTLTQTYEITKRPATFTSASVERPYTGEALTCDKVEMEGILEKDKDKISFEVTGSQADIGNSANAFEYQFSDKTIEKNYEITKVVGTLKVISDRVPTTPTVPMTK